MEITGNINETGSGHAPFFNTTVHSVSTQKKNHFIGVVLCHGDIGIPNANRNT